MVLSKYKQHSSIRKMLMKEKRTNLSNRDRKWLNKATKLAKMSQCSQRHGTVVTIGGRIVSVGINTDRYNPRETQYEIDPNVLAIHAEIAALRALGNEARGAKVYVSRWMHKSYKTGLSRPCDNCYEALVEAGVKEIIYT